VVGATVVVVLSAADVDELASVVVAAAVVVLVGAPVAVESSLPHATSIELAATASTPRDRVLARELRVIDRNPSVVGSQARVQPRSERTLKP
jgi:hypothetical protein